MKTKNLILVGYMGSGKTTIGIRLSYKMRRAFLDTDKLIEKKQKKTISDIFASEGEGAFRDMETSLLDEMIGKEDYKIISTGGGMAMREENRKILRKLGMVFYLKAKPETIYERLKGDTKRPLLQCEDPLAKIREMMESRESAYHDAAHVVISVDDKRTEEIVKEIKERYDEGFGN